MDPRPKADPNAFHEAVDAFRDMIPALGSEYGRIVADAQKRAFTVAGVAQLDLVAEVWVGIDRALANGTTLQDFRAEIEDKLTAAWGKEQPYRVETIFRTNVQHAYSTGRWEQQNDPVIKEFRPFWEFSAVMDSRTTDICRPINGTVLPADSPFWHTHNPPLHFSCRSTIITLSPKEAEAAGVTKSPPMEHAAEGFGGAPDRAEWKPDLSRYPHELAAKAAAKLAAPGG